MNKELDKRLKKLIKVYDDIFKPYELEKSKIDEKLNDLIKQRTELYNECTELKDRGKFNIAYKLEMDINELNKEIECYNAESRYLLEIIEKGNDDINTKKAKLKEEERFLSSEYSNIFGEYNEARFEAIEKAKEYEEKLLNEVDEEYRADIENYSKLTPLSAEYHFRR
ncbi:hypothetical protein GM168_12650 [Clostridium perfringens]|nr:hypothetical protein [Clostridium perfringens]ELP5182811.1 hypothetical protein [Clostridium perfringens]ELP5185363.1 hypothetical protein [Clostridium perfringens]ELP5188111.1 hypothetical protein [Clostridium perfringens]MDU6457316.1 hypothetical protein [Clostridium perfringens]